MRKLIFTGFVAAGSMMGFILAMDASWAPRLVVVFFGATSGAALGGFLVGLGKKGRRRTCGDEVLRGLGTTSDDLAENYWRDEGHPQFMKPPSPDDKQFGGSDGHIG
jgi:hypothetical protein